MKSSFLALSMAALTLAGCSDPATPQNAKAAAADTALLPNCGWQVKGNIASANWALPNTGTVYWAYIYNLEAGESLVLDGQYPGQVVGGDQHWTRFFSLQTYNAEEIPVEGDLTAIPAGSRVATIYDADIKPLPGSVNPYVAGADADTAPGRWRVTVSADAVNDPSTPATGDVIAAYPREAGAKPYGTRGALMLRYYLPVDGFPLTEDAPNKGGVELPVITHVDAKGNKTVVSECPSMVRKLVAKKVQPGTIKTPPVGFQENGPAFIRPLETDGVYPNVANRYLYAAAVYDADREDRMIRIRGKLPKTPKTMPAPYDGRQSAVVMPGAAGHDMRYWSIFVNKDAYPYPGVMDGGVADSDVKTDKDGFYTVIISKEEDRPDWWNDASDVRNRTINWVNWTDTDNIGERKEIGILFRNLLPTADFSHSVDAVPAGSSPEVARQVMGDYYPVVDHVSAKSL